jgi:hypothetical protein
MAAKAATETIFFFYFRGCTKPFPPQEKGDGVSEIYTVYSDIPFLVLTGIHLGVFQ